MTDFSDSLTIWLPGVLIMLGLVLCSGFFSASETAFFFLSRDQIRGFATGNSRQRVVARLMADPDRLLTAVLFWNLLINLAYFTVGIITINRLSASGFRMVATVVGVSNLIGMIVLGEVLPKSTAAVFRLRMAPLAGWPIAAAVRLLDPVIPVMGKAAQILRRTFWPDVTHEPHLNPQDLERAVDTSAALSSEMLHIEQQILHNILDLNEIRAEEVMRPRSYCIAVAPDGQLANWRGKPIGAVDYLMIHDTAKDLFTGAVALGAITSTGSQTFQDLAEPVVYVPWSASLSYVLTELRKRFCGVAVVVHEHGEMVGVVSYEDVLETILSESPSRTRRMLRREPLIEIGPSRFHVEGLATLRYIARRLRVPYDAENDTLLTLSGLFHGVLERIPRVNDCIQWNGWTLTAIEVTQRGQVRVLIEPDDGRGHLMPETQP